MCTVIIEIPVDAREPARLLAIRDEDPQRPWNPLGHWWPEHPSVVGVQDVRAGGAWLAADADTRRLAVLLNRAGGDDLPDEAVLSRGTLPLESVAGRPPAENPPMRGFNLLEVSPGAARVISWDGQRRRQTEIGPGIHMIAHDDVDDPATPRISQWLEHFRLARPGGDANQQSANQQSANQQSANQQDANQPDANWYEPWLQVLGRSAELGPVDDRAIVRDNRPFGYPTLSLLLCAATVGPDGVDVKYGELPAPGTWGAVDLH